MTSGSGYAATVTPTSGVQRQPSALATIACAGIIAGILDIGYVIVFYALKGIGAMRVLHGVAAGLVGREAAIKGGIATASLGLAIHFAIAVCVAAVFYAVSRKVRLLIEQPIVSGLIYGLIVWLVMNLAVLPLTATPPKSFPPSAWLPVLIAHLVCVGLPIAFVVRWREQCQLRR